MSRLRSPSSRASIYRTARRSSVHCDIASRIGAGGTSIMLVEGNRLRVRASVGIGVPLGHEQRVDEGIAGWVASRGERMVLLGPIDDDRFRGSDPQAGEAVIMPLRAG